MCTEFYGAVYVYVYMTLYNTREVLPSIASGIIMGYCIFYPTICVYVRINYYGVMYLFKHHLFRVNNTQRGWVVSTGECNPGGGCAYVLVE